MTDQPTEPLIPSEEPAEDYPGDTAEEVVESGDSHEVPD